MMFITVIAGDQSLKVTAIKQKKRFLCFSFSFSFFLARRPRLLC